MSLGAMLQLARKDVTVRDDAPQKLLLDKHVEFILSYERNKDSYEYTMMEYLRMSGVYWCVAALHLCGTEHTRLPVDDIVDFVKRCQHVDGSGGFGASDGHDPHLLHTLSAVQILVMYDRLDAIDIEKVVNYVTSLQQKDGSFVGDEWGENDTRFSFCAVACLSLLGRLDAINRNAAINHLLRCQNFDGGFGTRAGSESHAGQIYCCVGALSILGALQCVDADKLGWWLSERQLPSGGLNGRPEKLPDVCYSWWVLASITAIGRLHWVDKVSLRRYILACQDPEKGGFSDRPEDVTDPFHTLFGLAGLSLMGENSLEQVNPIYCMPQSCIRKCGAKHELLSM